MTIHGEKMRDKTSLSETSCFKHKENEDSSHLERSTMWGGVIPKSKFKHHPKHRAKVLTESKIDLHTLTAVGAQVQRQQIPPQKKLWSPLPTPPSLPCRLFIFKIPLRYFLHPSKVAVIINENLPVLDALCMTALPLKAKGNGGGQRGRGYGSHTSAHTHTYTRHMSGSLIYAHKAKNIN